MGFVDKKSGYNYTTCHMCGRTWNISKFQRQNPYTCPICRKKITKIAVKKTVNGVMSLCVVQVLFVPAILMGASNLNIGIVFLALGSLSLGLLGAWWYKALN